MTIIRPDKPVWCPTASAPIDAEQNKPNSARGSSFDARDLLGLAEGEAVATVKHHGCLIRVIERDGQKFPLRADFRGNRVNVVIDGGVVTSVGVY